MELSNLRPASGAVKSRKRIARGQGSGHGGTATRGHKGDKARSGFKNKRHFEGGQTPMQRRLPKRGFTNINRIDYVPLNLSQIETLVAKLGTTNFDVAALVAAGVAKASDRIKVLGNGQIKSNVTLKVHAISATAKSAIEACGGSVEIV